LPPVVPEQVICPTIFEFCARAVETPALATTAKARKNVPMRISHPLGNFPVTDYHAHFRRGRSFGAWMYFGNVAALS
jgi:hypothetical protein